jgi:hypothetical protein
MVTLLFALPFQLLVGLASSLITVRGADPHSIRIGDERERLVAALPVMATSRGPSWGKTISRIMASWNCQDVTHEPSAQPACSKEMRHCTIAAQKSRPHSPLAPTRCTHAYFLYKLGVYTTLDQHKASAVGPFALLWSVSSKNQHLYSTI